MKTMFTRKRLRQYSGNTLYALGGYLVAAAINLFSTWVANRYGQTPSQLLQVTLFIAGTAGFIVLISRALNRPKKAWVLVPEDLQPKPCAGLIVLVGKGRLGGDPLAGPYVPAIDFHLNGGALKVCWLVASQDSIHVEQALENKYKDQCKIIRKMIPYAFNVQDTYAAVREIYREEAADPAISISPGQIIADFTGGTKPMTAGMVLACGDEYRMQYMTDNPEGTALSIPLEVIFRRVNETEQQEG